MISSCQCNYVYVLLSGFPSCCCTRSITTWRSRRQTSISFHHCNRVHVLLSGACLISTAARPMVCQSDREMQRRGLISMCTYCGANRRQSMRWRRKHNANSFQVAQRRSSGVELPRVCIKSKPQGKVLSARFYTSRFCVTVIQLTCLVTPTSQYVWTHESFLLCTPVQFNHAGMAWQYYFILSQIYSQQYQYIMTKFKVMIIPLEEVEDDVDDGELPTLINVSSS